MSRKRKRDDWKLTPKQELKLAQRDRDRLESINTRLHTEIVRLRTLLKEHKAQRTAPGTPVVAPGTSGTPAVTSRERQGPTVSGRLVDGSVCVATTWAVSTHILQRMGLSVQRNTTMTTTDMEIHSIVNDQQKTIGLLATDVLVAAGHIPPKNVFEFLKRLTRKCPPENEYLVRTRHDLRRKHTWLTKLGVEFLVEQGRISDASLIVRLCSLF